MKFLNIMLFLFLLVLEGCTAEEVLPEYYNLNEYYTFLDV